MFDANVEVSPKERTKKESVVLFPQGIDKHDHDDLNEEELAAESNKEKNYQFHSRMLGTWMHLLVQAVLTGKENSLLFEKYKIFLDKHLSGNPKDRPSLRIEQQLKKGAAKMAQRIRVEANIPIGYTATWFTELMFEPSEDQVDIINKVRKNRRAVSLSQSLGYRSPDVMALSAITTTEEDGLQKILLQLDRKAKEVQQNPNMADVTLRDVLVLRAFVIAAISYYYFNFNGVSNKNNLLRQFDIDAVPMNMRKAILSGKARPDVIALAAKDDDQEAQGLISSFKRRAVGNRFGRSPLHDFSKLSLAEIHDQALWAIYQNVVRTLNFPREQVKGASALIDLMAAERRRDGNSGYPHILQLYKALKFVKQIVSDEHTFILAQSRWPILHIVNNSFHSRNIRWEIFDSSAITEEGMAENPVQVGVRTIDANQIIHVTARIGRKMIIKAIKESRQNLQRQHHTTPLDEALREKSRK